jgi:hypothetical protein
MQFKYYFDEAKNLIVVEKSGRATVAEEIELIKKIMVDPKYRKGMNTLSDLSSCTYKWTLKDIDDFRAFVYSLPKEIGTRKWALVASGGETGSTAKVFIKLYDIRSDVLKIRLFSSRFEAIKWLGSPDD